jgi:hypothetical protein
MTGSSSGGSHPANPVTRARLLVEAEVPLSRRGPGWDRHWRELEAYVETVCEWSTDRDHRNLV